MEDVEHLQGGDIGLMWRQRVGLFAAYALLGTTVPIMGGWTADAACRTLAREEIAEASSQNREPREPGWVHDAVCNSARWIVAHTP